MDLAQTATRGIVRTSDLSVLAKASRELQFARTIAHRERGRRENGRAN